MAETLASKCPSCGAALRFKTTLAVTTRGVRMSRPPEPGDPSICIRCGLFLEFDKDLHAQPLSEEGFARLSPQLRQVLYTLRQTILSSPRSAEQVEERHEDEEHPADDVPRQGGREDEDDREGDEGKAAA